MYFISLFFVQYNRWLAFTTRFNNLMEFLPTTTIMRTSLQLQIIEVVEERMDYFNGWRFIEQSIEIYLGYLFTLFNVIFGWFFTTHTSTNLRSSCQRRYENVTAAEYRSGWRNHGLILQLKVFWTESQDISRLSLFFGRSYELYFLYLVSLSNMQSLAGSPPPTNLLCSCHRRDENIITAYNITCRWSLWTEQL